MANQLVINVTNTVNQANDNFVRQMLYELYDDPALVPDPNERGESYLLLLDRNPAQATLYEGITNQTFPPTAVGVWVFIDWPETVARIVGTTFHSLIFYFSLTFIFSPPFPGRRGANIIHVRQQTQTWISSPRLNTMNDLRAANDRHSSTTFVIRAVDEARALKATLILLLLSRYYREEVNNQYRVPRGEVREDVLAPRDLIHNVTGLNGRWIIALQEICAVRIVTPKTYAISPVFAVIGPEVSLPLLLRFGAHH